jgi:hypothetical protein
VDPVLSVVIPAFNDEACVVSAVESVLAQSRRCEVVVIDDGSTDHTAGVVADIGDWRISVVRQDNQGPAAARNAGAQRARGSGLVFLDSDDVLLPGAIDLFADAHQMGHQLVRTCATVQRQGQITEVPAVRSGFPFPRGSPLAGSFSVGRELFHSIHGFDHAFRYGENSELLFRAQREVQSRGESVFFADISTVFCSDRPDRSSTHYATARLAAVELMLEKHGEALRADKRTTADHHAIASHLHSMAGNRVDAKRHAIASLRYRPASLRSWGRVIRNTFHWSGITETARRG